jgi:hypothetical protein
MGARFSGGQPSNASPRAAADRNFAAAVPSAAHATFDFPAVIFYSTST